MSKGPVNGASVSVLGMNSDGSPGASVAGPFTTDVAGNWTGQLAAGQAGPLLLRSTGGSYVDEATSATVPIGVGRTLYGILSGGASQVTPFTHATYVGMAAQVDNGATLASAVTQALASSQTAFGFNFATTVPSNSGSATTAQKQYAALLGGLSTMLNANAALSAFSATPPADLVLAVCTDMSDGKLDGLDAGGTPIQVPTSAPGLSQDAAAAGGTSTAPLPALSGSDISALLTAANTYASGQPNLSGVTFSISATWNPAAIAAGPCVVTMGGSGVSVLPSNCFNVSTSQVVSGAQFVWEDLPDDVQILVVPATLSSGIIQTLYVSRPVGLGPIWNTFNLGGIAGIVRSGNQLNFTNVSVPELTLGGTTLTLNGSLTIP